MRAADWCATFDDDDTELAHADVLVEDGVIAAVGVDLDPGPVDRIVDGRGLVLLPGLINSHQHLYQGACRAVPDLERALIGPWLRGLGALVKGWWPTGASTRRGRRDQRGSAHRVVARGVTTVADQHYFFPAVLARLRGGHGRRRAKSASVCTRAGVRSPKAPIPTSPSRSTRSCVTARP